MPDADYAILGSVTVRRPPGAAPLALSDQHKVLLGRLLLDPGARVTTGALVEALWGATPGANPRNALQVTVSAVRGLLGDTGRVRRVIVTDGDAYRLVIDDPLSVDAVRFKRLTQRGGALAAQQPRVAHAMLSDALSMWHGPLLGEFADRVWAAGHADELESIRDRAEVNLNEVKLALGELSDLEGMLRLQIAHNPHDERRRGQLVRVLDRAGRSAEAQLAYRAAYRDLGAVGPALQRIGEEVARGATPAARRAPPARGVNRAGRPDGALLCAVLDSRRLLSRDPGLGILSLIVDRFGGESHPMSEDTLVAVFANVDETVSAASAIAAAGAALTRVGVHVGGIVRLGERISGPGPARCQELVRGAHPGQVLVTAAAQSRASSRTRMNDLGEQRFFDLAPSERVYELTGDGRKRFPPPATLSRLLHNLPVQTTRFVGREEELATLSRMVAGGDLITLTGAGGCGKTRLALQLAAGHAQGFTDGAWFVELAEVAVGANVESVAGTVAHQLAVRALPGERPLAALTRHLSDRNALLVIDNCEHVHTACVRLVVALRAGCRDVCIVATTRRPLRTDGEHVVSVASMAVDAGATDGLPSDAVQLLLDRAGPLPSDPAISDDTLACAARICRALDGLPLAIELAAAHVPTLGLRGVATEVEAMMSGERDLAQFASGDPRRPDRQRTIESTIDWSYRLLTGAQRRVLRRLSVLHGTFTAVEARQTAEISPGDAGRLQDLVDCSMVAVAAPVDGIPRLRLVEPIRAFAHNLLSRSREFERTRSTHAKVFLALAVDTAPRLFGPDEQVCLQRLEADHDNLRASLAWHVERCRGRDAQRLVGALWWLWFSHGHLEEGCAWVERSLAIDDEPSRERVRALRAGSHLAWWRGDHAQCDAYNVALDGCARTIDDKWGLAWVAMGFGATQVFRDPHTALPLFEDSKRRFDALGRKWEAGYTLHLIGGARWFSGDEPAAGEAFEEAVAIFGQLGHRSVLASVERCAGLMAARCGKAARGITLCNDALRISDAIHDRAGSAQALNFLASISRDQGDPQTGVARHAEALRLAREVGDLWATCWALDGLAGAARRFREPEIATRLLASSTKLAARSWYMPSPGERELRGDDHDSLRAELGGEDFERAAADGAVMGVGEVVSCALAFASRHAGAAVCSGPGAAL
jgi:predicted ATPase/DNA-binding SARP family transcriptional activator